MSPAHNAALACNLNDAKLIGYFNVPSSNACAQFANISRDDFIRNYARATAVAGKWLSDGAAVQPNNLLNFLIPFFAQSEAHSTSLDVKAQKTFHLPAVTTSPSVCTRAATPSRRTSRHP